MFKIIKKQLRIYKRIYRTLLDIYDRCLAGLGKYPLGKYCSYDAKFIQRNRETYEQRLIKLF